MFNDDSKSKNFQENIRAYNMIFTFTSMGVKVDTSINKGGAPYVFKMPSKIIIGLVACYH